MDKSRRKTPSKKAMPASGTKKALLLIKRKGGIIRTSEAIDLGIHAVTLYRLRDQDQIEQISRGIFRLRSLPSITNPDLVTVAKRIPKGVVCLISALAFHGLTTQIPRHVFIALPRRAMKPRMNYPPIRIFWYSDDAIKSGVHIHKIDGVSVPVFSAEKSVADAFKYRNKIGFDVALEALQIWRKKRGDLDHLLKFAKICRVEKVMRPYLEAML